MGQARLPMAMEDAVERNARTHGGLDRARASGVDAHIGWRIRERRVQRRMSQTQLAGSIGVSYQQLQKYETGTNRIAASRLAEIADVFDVPVASFFSGPTAAESPLSSGAVEAGQPAAMQGLDEAAAALQRAGRGKGAIPVLEILKPLANALLVAEIEARPEDTELLVALHSWAAATAKPKSDRREVRER